MSRQLVSIVALSFVLAACGGSSTTDAGSDTPSTSDAPTVSTTVDVTMADYSFTLSTSSVPAGSVTFEATNEGTHPHEMVIARTDLAPDSLPRDGSNQVDEAMLDIPGEIPETEPGMGGSLTVDLTPGSYVLFCNVGTHYSSGMYIAFTVTAP